MNKGHKILNILIVIGLIAGVAFGLLLYKQFAAEQLAEQEILQRLDWMKVTGDLILIRPLKMLIIPLIFASVVVGITSIGNPSKLGIIGGSTLFYYFTTMLIAVIIGAFIVTTVNPGGALNLTTETAAAQFGDKISTGMQTALETRQTQGLGGAWLNILKQLIPTNVIKSAANGEPLPVISFSILFGLALTWIGDRGKPVVTFMQSFFDAIMTMVQWVIWLTPIGVFLLIAWSVGKLGGQALESLGWYMACVLIGLAIHAIVILPAILLLFGRTNPYRFMWKMRPALMTAFGTDSSSATLPVTMETAEGQGECSKKASGFVLPLGSTINMDGTALYEAVAVVFLFQAFGFHLSFAQLAIVVITATLAAIGAAGIPSAGLVTMVLVIQAVNTSLAGTGVEALPVFAIGFILGVDRILDMCRTTVNVWGDAVGAKIITRIAPDG